MFSRTCSLSNMLAIAHTLHRICSLKSTWLAVRPEFKVSHVLVMLSRVLVLVLRVWLLVSRVLV